LGFDVLSAREREKLDLLIREVKHGRILGQLDARLKEFTDILRG